MILICSTKAETALQNMLMEAAHLNQLGDPKCPTPTFDSLANEDEAAFFESEMSQALEPPDDENACLWDPNASLLSMCGEDPDAVNEPAQVEPVVLIEAKEEHPINHGVVTPKQAPEASCKATVNAWLQNAATTTNVAEVQSNADESKASEAGEEDPHGQRQQQVGTSRVLYCDVCGASSEDIWEGVFDQL
jgi:hypothetical protein